MNSRTVQPALRCKLDCESVARPVCIAFSTALKAESADLFAFPPQWIPDPIVWSNFAKAWDILPFIRYLYNTFYIAIATVLVNVFLSSMTGFALARMHFRGRQFILYAVLATTMVPFQVLLIPLFIVTLKLGLVDSYAGVILPVAVNAFGIFLLRQAFSTIPKDLEDAARIDGCSDWHIFSRIMIPLVKPALATLAAFTLSAERFYMATHRAEKPRSLHAATVAGWPAGAFGVNGATLAASIIALVPTVVFSLPSVTKGMMAGQGKDSAYR